ncbi:MAG: hypothetical protein HQK77_08535 [Desulfobacterales bacterium]|nr:hypothetical protein [Desulfobacterales bacterium]
MLKQCIVQFYEIQTADEAEIMISLGVDHIGTVLLSEDVWQQDEIKKTIDLIRQSSSKSSLIPLFSSINTLLRCIDFYQPHIIHFCESLFSIDNPTSLIENQIRIKKAFPNIKIMRTIPVGIRGNRHAAYSKSLASEFSPVSDFLLLDTFIDVHEPVQGFVGITGQPCDWHIASEIVTQSTIPVILAGGLSHHNVFDAISVVHPAGVDSCTCTNRCDDQGRPIRFQKDIQKVRQFINEVKRANQMYSHTTNNKS